MNPPLFRSWLQGGFECSTMVFGDGRRVDVSAASGHDRLAVHDYRMLADLGVRTVRDGVRWHLVEPTPGQYDWSSWRAMLAAARDAGVQVIWDLLHFGYPEWCEPWTPGFVEQFAGFCEAAARVFAEETDETPFWAPVNEISYWAFAAGHAHFAPFGPGRGDEWKRQLSHCAIAGVEAVRRIDPRARCVHTDPVVHVLARPGGDEAAADVERRFMFHAWDMIAGLSAPELGGSPEHLDVIGVNFYADNQWVRDAERSEWHLDRQRVGMGMFAYRPLHEILQELWGRYGRPLVISETGAEGANGPGWLRYVCGEVEIAREKGVPVEGVCIYPVMDYPGWGDHRHCGCGLIEVCSDWRDRTVVPLMAREIHREQAIAASLADRAPLSPALEAVSPTPSDGQEATA